MALVCVCVGCPGRCGGLKGFTCGRKELYCYYTLDAHCGAGDMAVRIGFETMTQLPFQSAWPFVLAAVCSSLPPPPSPPARQHDDDAVW